MRTRIIKITIELDLESEQAKNWVDEDQFVESTVNEIFSEKIKDNLFDEAGEFETDDEKGKYKIEIVDLEE